LRSRLVGECVKLTGVAASEEVAIGPTFVHIHSELEPEHERDPQ
jgi:hypothetical protein